MAYDPAWSAWCERIAGAVAEALGGVDHAVEHVGSTAVPGLSAKPIVDVDVVVPGVEVIPAAVARLDAAGWAHLGDRGIPGREAFEPRPDLPYHHLYVVVDGSPPHRDHVDLRDYLRTHPAAVAEYAAAKERLAHLLATDREAYADGKADLVTDLLARARRG